MNPPTLRVLVSSSCQNLFSARLEDDPSSKRCKGHTHMGPAYNYYNLMIIWQTTIYTSANFIDDMIYDHLESKFDPVDHSGGWFSMYMLSSFFWSISEAILGSGELLLVDGRMITEHRRGWGIED